jgi:predicted metalloprotease
METNPNSTAPQPSAPFAPTPKPRARRVRHTILTFAMATVMAFGVVAGVAGEAHAQVAQSYDAPVDATIADIQNYWTQTMPGVYGQSYEAIPTDRIYPYSSSNPPPNCDDGGQTKAPYEQVQGNAFYCGNGDFVAYDEEGLIPKLRSQFGEFAVGLVFAHELGHAVQARVGYQPSATIYAEQQADCFAGSWAAHVADSTDANVHLSSQDLDSALAGLLTLSDPSGTDGSQDGAHGSGFDRVSAFQDGYEGGAQACADYQNNPPSITESGYTSSSDQANDGNLPLDQMIPAITDSLQSYWPTALGTSSSSTTSSASTPKIVAAAGGAQQCDGASDGGVLSDSVTYCPSTDTIAYDPTALQTAHDSIGDFASGALLAAEWSSAVQHQLGQSLGTKAARTTAECLTGAWAGNLSGQSANGSSTLSPGDLDEAVSLLVAGNHQATDRGTAFDRVAAFRKGFKSGPSACVAN